jgi:hypothetical protein
VESALSTLLPATAAALGPSVTPAAVSDLGDHYTVTIGDHAKTYPDPRRDCAERARVAAAFIALILAPEAQPGPSATARPPPVPAPPPAPPVAPPPPRPPARPRVRWLQVDARGALEMGSQGQAAPGAALSAAGGWDALGAHAVCGWVAAAPVHIPGVTGSVLVERFPCALGPTLRLPPYGGRRVEIDVDAGVSLGSLRARGRGFAVSYESTRLEAGVRLAVDAAIHIGLHPAGFSPVVGLELTYDPKVYDLEVMPRGVVAQTPYLWAGFTGGVRWAGGL